MNLLKKIRSSMVINIIFATIIILVTFGIVVCTISYYSFTNSFLDEYSTSSYHMADTASTLVNGDNIDDYLIGKRRIEYDNTKMYLDGYCNKMNVSLVYVIKVDESDYGSFVSVFNSVNNRVDDTAYQRWELGYERQATNDEYIRKYRDMYEHTVKYATVYRWNPEGDTHPHITTMVPVKNTAGDVTAILCIQRPMRELQDARENYIINIVMLTIILIITVAVLTLYYIRSRFVRPLMKVADETARFAKENTKGEDLANISSFQELSTLGHSIDTMETDMVNYIDNLTDVTAKQERIEAELQFAENIQQNSIPNEFPAFPDRKDIDIYATMDPAKEVGGDFYNYFFLDDDHLVLVVGDVSDKGVPAALFMMISNLVIRDRCHMGGTPSEIMEFVNKHLIDYNKAEMFVTIWLGILELSTGKVVCVNAGHEDPIVYHKGKGYEVFESQHGLVAGVMEDLKYKDFEFTINKGDKIFLYTDGVPEATNANEELFSVERTVDALNEIQDGTPEETLAHVRKRIDEFVGEAPQFDDLTMVCFEWKDSE